MSEEKVLTKEIAEQFLANQKDDFSAYTTIYDDAAEVLASSEGDLCLDGLTELSDSSAESLSRHQGFMSIDNGWGENKNILDRHPNGDLKILP